MKFGQLILRKIIKTVASRCHILRLKYIKIDFAPQDTLAGIKGRTGLQGGEEEERGRKTGSVIVVNGHQTDGRTDNPKT